MRARRADDFLFSLFDGPCALLLGGGSGRQCCRITARLERRHDAGRVPRAAFSLAAGRESEHAFRYVFVASMRRHHFASLLSAASRSLPGHDAHVGAFRRFAADRAGGRRAKARENSQRDVAAAPASAAAPGMALQDIDGAGRPRRRWRRSPPSRRHRRGRSGRDFSPGRVHTPSPPGGSVRCPYF